MFYKKKIEKLIKEKLDFVVVLGSGYKTVLSDLPIVKKIPYKKIKEAKETLVSGHEGVFELRILNNKKIAILRGRSHIYEGYEAHETTSLIRALAISQIKMENKPVFILTNASGSTSKDFAPGDLCLIKDHINFISKTPLLGPKFIDMTDTYNKELRNIVIEKAKNLKIPLKEAVYTIMEGPQYETPSEVKMLKKIGADLVGMSTVPEIIELQYLGLKKIALAIVSNFGTGVSEAKLSHQEVSKQVSKTAKNISFLLKEFICG